MFLPFDIYFKIYKLARNLYYRTKYSDMNEELEESRSELAHIYGVLQHMCLFPEEYDDVDIDEEWFNYQRAKRFEEDNITTLVTNIESLTYHSRWYEIDLE